METATVNLQEAKAFADAIHAEFPDKMLAYNLSPLFNWGTTGMSEEEMKRFPEELGKLAPCSTSSLTEDTRSMVWPPRISPWRSGRMECGFLLQRYKAGLVHYLSPTEDNQHQAQKMKRLGIFSNVNTEAALIIVASVNASVIADLVNPDRIALRKLIAKTNEYRSIASPKRQKGCPDAG